MSKRRTRSGRKSFTTGAAAPAVKRPVKGVGRHAHRDYDPVTGRKRKGRGT